MAIQTNRQRDARGRFVRRGARLGGSPNRRYKTAMDPTTTTTMVVREEPDPYPPRRLISPPISRRSGGGVAADIEPSEKTTKPTAEPISKPTVVSNKRLEGIIDGLTGRSFVFVEPSTAIAMAKNGGLDEQSGIIKNNIGGWRRQTNQSAAGWRIVASGGGARPITLAALIRPSTSELTIFATDVRIPVGTTFNADRFEWRPTYADEHAAVLRRVQAARNGGIGNGLLLTGPALKTALADLQVKTGAVIASDRPTTATIRPLISGTDRLCAGYAKSASDGSVVGALMVDGAGKASWIGARGRVSLADARRSVGYYSSDIAELSAPAVAVDALKRCRSGVEPAAFLALLSARR